MSSAHWSNRRAELIAAKRRGRAMMVVLMAVAGALLAIMQLIQALHYRW